MTPGQLGRTVGVSISLVRQVLARRPKRRAGRPRRIKVEQDNALWAQLEANPAATAAVHAQQWDKAQGTTMQPSTMRAAIYRLGWTRIKGRWEPPSTPRATDTRLGISFASSGKNRPHRGHRSKLRGTSAKIAPSEKVYNPNDRAAVTLGVFNSSGKKCFYLRGNHQSRSSCCSPACFQAYFAPETNTRPLSIPIKPTLPGRCCGCRKVIRANDEIGSPLPSRPAR